MCFVSIISAPLLVEFRKKISSKKILSAGDLLRNDVLEHIIVTEEACLILLAEF